MFSTLRHLLRLSRIGYVLARHGALFPLEQLATQHPAAGFAGRTARRLTRRDLRELAEGERLARALTALGPSFVKLGQVLSIRADLIGETVARDLARLQDRLPPFPGADARRIIEQSFERPISDLFAQFDDVPVAAASVAQVHFAETTDGREVAVKVLRPGVERALATDLALFAWIARWLERLLPGSRRLKPVEVVRTLSEVVAIETDLRMEAAAGQELRENFEGDPGFMVPEIDWMRTAARVMTLERITGGVRADDTAALDAAGLDGREIMANAARVFFLQVFRDGFFHGDMHPGNLFILPDGRIAVVDFGIMGRLDRQSRLYLAEMLRAFLTRDYDAVADVHFAAGFVPPDQSRPLFAQAARSIGEPILGKPQNEISIGRLLAQLFQVTTTFQMETQPQLLLLQKTMVQAEGMARLLDPGANMWVLAEPLIREWMAANLGPRARAETTLREMLHVAQRLPRIMDRLETLSDPERPRPVIMSGSRLSAAIGGGLLVALLWLILG
ncbi:2-polyprenylphenol 6-hydroxylase [Tistrella mobilis]|uniref:2-octaprenylphenol hydroxylase n=1 Tax=Tistrella mobilis TaxID=171437 RepID=A0A161Q275_9PROT|nr:2-polyprenylphenol 6-hydroxylase [Tistrella mobilis]KYO51593.1 2-octaprenylphenol hydroxylase [Tistrella mobilis]